MAERFKVLVVGGGPSGSIAARELAKKGIDTCLFERDLNNLKPCGGGIPSTAFDELALPTTVINKEIREIHIYSPANVKVAIPLKGGHLSMVDRRSFDSAMRAQAKDAGATIIEGEFFSIGQTSGVYEASFMLKVSRERMTIKADYVIAADGVNSRISSCLGIKPQRCINTIHEEVDGIDGDACEFWFGSEHAPAFYSWVFPKKGHASIGTGCLKGNPLPMLERFKMRRSVATNGTARAYRIPMGPRGIWAANRILFVGDAAGTVMPLSYEGIYYSMKSGEMAAMAIADAKPGLYEKMWKALYAKRFLLMRRLEKHFLKDDAASERLVELHRRPEIQAASMRLWLEKDLKSKSLLSYIGFLKRFLTG